MGHLSACRVALTGVQLAVETKDASKIHKSIWAGKVPTFHGFQASGEGITPVFPYKLILGILGDLG
jgi:hypothetical protein